MLKHAKSKFDELAEKKCDPLYEGAVEEGIKPHKLPDTPADVEDDGQFRLVVLGADYAGVVGDPPLAKAQEFLRTHSSPSDTRTYQNIVLVATPSVTGLHQAEQQIAEWLAWEEIETSSQFKDLDSFQQKTVRDKKRDSLKAAQTSVKNAYELVLYLEKDGSIQAKKITLGAQSLFATLMQETALRLFREKIDAEAIMPNGLYPGLAADRFAYPRRRLVSAVWARSTTAETPERSDRSQHDRRCGAARRAGCSLCSHGPVRGVVLAFGDRRHGLGQERRSLAARSGNAECPQFGGSPSIRTVWLVAEDRRRRQTLGSVLVVRWNPLLRGGDAARLSAGRGRSQRWTTPS